MALSIGAFFFLSVIASSLSYDLCFIVCDGEPNTNITNVRYVFSGELFSRQISIAIADNENIGYAVIKNGAPGDAVWIDRTFQGGRVLDDGANLGLTVIPSNETTASTTVVNIDGEFEAFQVGALRACGRAADHEEVYCTPWTRGARRTATPVEAAATALMMDYNFRNLWNTGGWASSSHCVATVAKYMKLTNDFRLQYALFRTYEFNNNILYGNFCSGNMDETGWWGLGWIAAYDVINYPKFFESALATCDFMYTYKDDKCGGGIYYSVALESKTAITNALFIKLAASIHNRLENDTKYLNMAEEAWAWFNQTGLINSDNLVNEGLDDNCQNNGGEIWTQDQGAIVGALGELFKATGKKEYLIKGRQIADAAVSSTHINVNGILHEPCDHDGNDCLFQRSYKGAFARNLGEFNEILEDKPYTEYLKANAKVIYENRNSIDQYGLHYEGPLEFQDAKTQHSALDMLLAAYKL